MSYLKTFVRNMAYLAKHSLWQQREDDIVYLTEKILNDGIVEYGLNLPGYEQERVLEKFESIKTITQSKKSFVRLGDGEVAIMKGISQPFQKAEPEIQSVLLDLLTGKYPNILVGLNKNYYTPGYILNSKYDRRNDFDFRVFFNKYSDKKMTYIDGACTFYFPQDERSKQHESFWNLWLEAFKDKNIVIICGEGILDKLEYDVFKLAASKEFIFGPKKHAWDCHKELVDKIHKVSKDKLLVFILGMAGKAMIPELTKEGYLCWDIGHLAKSYDVYMRNVPFDPIKFYAPD